MEQRLQKYLALAGVSSRRKAEEMMAEGRITVNGQPAQTLGMRVDPDRDFVKVDGKTVRPEKLVYVLLNKPKGVLCTMDDPEGRPTVSSMLRGVRGRLFPVGRLDWDTTGALLMTNDGDLAQKLIHPSHGVPRVYMAKVQGVPTPAQLDKLRRGVWVEGRKTLPAKVDLAGKMEKNSVLRFVLREGRNRQVKNMCMAVGHSCLRLERVAFGHLMVRGMAPGTWRYLTPGEVADLSAQADRAIEMAKKGRDPLAEVGDMERPRKPSSGFKKRVGTNFIPKNRRNGFDAKRGGGAGRPDGFKPAQGSSRPARPQGGFRPERGGGAPRPERGGAGHRPERGSGASRPERGGAGHRPERGSGGGRPERGSGGHRPERGGGGNRPEPAKGFTMRSKRGWQGGGRHGH